jgi:hypothetical protein
MKAFPHVIGASEDVVMIEEGMDLRDYFAGQAMNEMFDSGWIDGGIIEEVDLNHLAKWSYKMADAMMKARESND